MSSPISNNNPLPRVSQNEPSAKKAPESSSNNTVDSTAVAMKGTDVLLDPNVAEALKGSDSVSYTHLTLPTKRIV